MLPTNRAFCAGQAHPGLRKTGYRDPIRLMPVSFRPKVAFRSAKGRSFAERKTTLRSRRGTNAPTVFIAAAQEKWGFRACQAHPTFNGQHSSTVKIDKADWNKSCIAAIRGPSPAAWRWMNPSCLLKLRKRTCPHPKVNRGGSNEHRCTARKLAGHTPTSTQNRTTRKKPCRILDRASG